MPEVEEDQCKVVEEENTVDVRGCERHYRRITPFSPVDNFKGIEEPEDKYDAPSSAQYD